MCEGEGEMWAARWKGQTTWGFVGSSVGKLLGLKLMVLLGPLPIPGAWNFGVYWASHREIENEYQSPHMEIGARSL